MVSLKHVYIKQFHSTAITYVIIRKRIDGDLAVSRAFGDFDYKRRKDLDARHQKVTCLPDIRVLQRSSSTSSNTEANEDMMLILACDGLWDVMTSSEAVETDNEIFLSGEDKIALVVEEMLDLALNKGMK